MRPFEQMPVHVGDGEVVARHAGLAGAEQVALTA